MAGEALATTEITGVSPVNKALIPERKIPSAPALVTGRKITPPDICRELLRSGLPAGIELVNPNKSKIRKLYKYLPFLKRHIILMTTLRCG